MSAEESNDNLDMTGGISDDLLAEIDALNESTDQAEDDVNRFSEKKQAEDRSKISAIIVWSFVSAIFCIIIFLIVAGWFGNSADMPWEKAATIMVDLLSSVMLPVVTLVLGYYFGTAKNNDFIKLYLATDQHRLSQIKK